MMVIYETLFSKNGGNYDQKLHFSVARPLLSLFLLAEEVVDCRIFASRGRLVCPLNFHIYLLYVLITSGSYLEGNRKNCVILINFIVLEQNR